VENINGRLTVRDAAKPIEQMTLGEVALAFCKECRGWENAVSVNDWGFPCIYENVSKELSDRTTPPWRLQFNYIHMDYVAKAVREWIKPLDITPPQHAKIFADVIPDVFARFFVGSLDEAGLCYELMAACVKANRGQQETRQNV
jgi:hypothetical protein